jgi:hypothetical protein
MSVSIKDFNLWLTQNKRWSQYKTEKVRSSLRRRLTQDDPTLPSLCVSALSLCVLKVRRMDEKHQQEIDSTISQPK